MVGTKLSTPERQKQKSAGESAENIFANTMSLSELLIVFEEIISSATPDTSDDVARNACYAARECWQRLHGDVMVLNTPELLKAARRLRTCLRQADHFVLGVKERAVREERGENERTELLQHYLENIEFRAALLELLLEGGPDAVNSKIREGIPSRVDPDVFKYLNNKHSAHR